MKTLVLMRHSLAMSQHPSGDFYRKLSDAGIERAKKQFEKLKLKIENIDYMLHSSAQRTTETAEIALASFKLDARACKSVGSFYGSSIPSYLLEIALIPAEVRTALIIGHNPTISDLCHHLIPSVYLAFNEAEALVISSDADSWLDFSISNLKADFYNKIQ